MIKNLVILLMLINLNLIGQIKPDKYYHASAGVLISGSTYTIGQFSKREMNPIAPSLLSLTGACSKEFYDTMNGGYFSYKDALWTTVSGVVTSRIIRVIWKPKKKDKPDPFDFNPELVEK